MKFRRRLLRRRGMVGPKGYQSERIESLPGGGIYRTRWTRRPMTMLRADRRRRNRAARTARRATR